ncbi:MAG: hypothetical protein ACR2F6_05800 [Mycobacteriales bacterium]
MASPMVRRHCPGGRVTMVVGFEQPVLVDGHKHPSFVIGMRDGSSVTEQVGAQHGLQVDLSPLGARVLLGVPMHQLSTEVVPVADLLGGRLTEQLAEAATPERRFELLDALIAARLADAPPPDPTVAWGLPAARHQPGTDHRQRR